MKKDKASNSHFNLDSIGKPLAVAPILALLIGLFMVALGNGLQGTLVPIRAGLEGLQEETVGFIMSAYFVGYASGTIFCPKLVVRVGHIRTFAALASIASAATLSHLFIIEPISWSIFRVFNGFCIAGLSVVNESWLNGHAAPGHRGKILSIYGLMTVGGTTFGQLLLNIANPSDFLLFCVVSVLISFSLVPVSLTRATAPTIVGPTKFNFKQLYRVAPLSVMGIFITGLTMGAFLGMGPTFAQKIGLDTAGISAFMVAIMLGTLVFQWPIGWYSDKVDRRIVIALAAIANALVCLGFIWWPTSTLVPLLPLAFLLGGFGQPLYSLCVAHANDNISTDEMLSTASTLLLIFGVGSILGPLLTSLTMGQIGPVGLFHFVGLFYLVLAVITLYQLTRRSTISQEDQQANYASTYLATRIGIESDTNIEERK